MLSETQKPRVLASEGDTGDVFYIWALDASWKFKLLFLSSGISHQLVIVLNSVFAQVGNTLVIFFLDWASFLVGSTRAKDGWYRSFHDFFLRYFFVHGLEVVISVWNLVVVYNLLLCDFDCLVVLWELQQGIKALALLLLVDHGWAVLGAFNHVFRQELLDFLNFI